MRQNIFEIINIPGSTINYVYTKIIEIYNDFLKKMKYGNNNKLIDEVIIQEAKENDYNFNYIQIEGDKKMTIKQKLDELILLYSNRERKNNNYINVYDGGKINYKYEIIENKLEETFIFGKKYFSEKQKTFIFHQDVFNQENNILKEFVKKYGKNEKNKNDMDKMEALVFILKYYTRIIKDINNQEVKSMNNKLIKIFEKEVFTDEDYKKILSSIDDKIFNEVKLFIYDKIDYFNECLKLYLDKDFNISGKTVKLYKWINDKLNMIQKGTYKHEKFLENIQENSLPLASLSLNKFYELSKEIFQGNYKKIVEKLKGDKNIQLEYIQLLLKYIISTYENNEYNVTNEEMEEIKYILEIHISLLIDKHKGHLLLLQFIVVNSFSIIIL